MEQTEDEAQADLVVQTLTMDQFKAMLDAEKPTQEMIEAAWEVFDAEGIEAPPVETMEAVWAAMWRAR
jgi:hypothetical protein